MTALHSTTDPYLASFLLSEGVALAGCRRVGPKKVRFTFESGWRTHELLRLYWSRKPIPVPPAKLFDALRVLKSRTLTRGS